MSIRTVNALSHYTDWTIGHVHSGALGWVAMISIGSIYYLIPRLFGQEKMYSIPAISLHFWMSTLGVVLYIASMWIAGVMQGLMWRAINDDGTLTYTFVESVKDSYPFWTIRFVGGLLFLSGMFVMAWNVWRTTHRRPKPYNVPAVAPRCRALLIEWRKTSWLHPKKNRTHVACWSIGITVVTIDRWHRRDRSLVLGPALDHRGGEGRSVPTARSSWPGATSTSARAATTAIRR
jgi:heme/copper-type cytochrome/quinol oxidase subunit 1